GTGNSCIQAKNTGSYYVTVMDMKGCTAESNHLEITADTQSIALQTNKAMMCASDSAQICTVNNSSSYLWNTEDTTACIQAHEAGEYYIRVIDTIGCVIQSKHIDISVYSVPSVSIFI